MATRIVLMENPMSATEIARELCPAEFELVVGRLGTPEFAAAMRDAPFLIGLGDPAIDDAFYRAAPGLKLFQLLSAGYDRCDIEAARRAGVPICNNGGANATAVAEHTLMLMLACCRRLPWQHESVASGRWRGNDPAQVRLFELRGRTLGIVGLGTIGKKVARLASALGMAVQYYDIRRLTEAEEDALGVRFRLLREVLASSDVVSLHVPLLPSTHHMIGAAELALMQPSSYLINTCRGPVVDEAALTRALESGAIAGAGLDVFEQEPTPPGNPLLRLPNVVLTPHFAGPTWDNQETRFRNAFDNCQRVARGEAPLWVIPELAGPPQPG
ncbi:MAG TPA: 2-hydroxyacid dehydrogenase [Crenalkalicoccus sp.]|nr:2-hydroxyacid dehydrogenase [Crenalkalicoccus sp.]